VESRTRMKPTLGIDTGFDSQGLHKNTMEIEQLDISKIVLTRMIIGNENGRIADIDLTKTCDEENCINISYKEDGTLMVE